MGDWKAIYRQLLQDENPKALKEMQDEGDLEEHLAEAHKYAVQAYETLKQGVRRQPDGRPRHAHDEHRLNELVIEELKELAMPMPDDPNPDLPASPPQETGASLPAA